MEKSSDIRYSPRGDATPEAELDALSQVYAFILQKHQERKKGSGAAALDDVVKESNGYDATTNHNR